MKSVNSKVYSKEYYLNVCHGYKEFNSDDLNARWKKIVKIIPINKNTKILDLGCGRGDVCFYFARKGVNVVGVDYSKDAINFANEKLKKSSLDMQKRITFIKQDAKKIKFQENLFDAVIAFDFFEHLYKEELEIVMEKISKILKKNGLLLVHTEVNKIYLDFTHKFYTYPLAALFVFLNNFIFNKSYQNMPKDPRNEYHKIQHVNEPTFFYLKKLFSKYKFKGKINQNIGMLKPVFKWKDKIYNFIVCLYPFCNYFPLNILFATDYVCIMKNKK